jgi:hypothetical protein
VLRHVCSIWSGFVCTQQNEEELAHALVSKGANSHLKQDLWDYTVLLDGVLGSEEPAKDTTAKDDLTTT